MRELQQEVKVAQQNCRSQQTVVQITQKRYETGLVSKLDVAQAQSVYYSTKASLPMLEAGIIQYANSLAILLGCTLPIYKRSWRQTLPCRNISSRSV